MNNEANTGVIQYRYCIVDPPISPPEIIVNIDFDKAISEWRKNKRHIGEGIFQYTCQYIHSNGKQCNKSVYTGISTNKYQYNFGGVSEYNTDDTNYKKACKRHINRFINKNN